MLWRVLRAMLREVTATHEKDPETAAIELCALGLAPLSLQSRKRVMNHVWQRLVVDEQAAAAQHVFTTTGVAH